MSDALDDWLVRVCASAPSINAIERARLLLLDTVGCAIAGLQAPSVAALVAHWAALDTGTFMLPVPGNQSETAWALRPPRVSLSTAASLLATAACWDEACEGLASAHGRPGVPVVAGVLALGVARGHSMDQVLRALVVGYEVGGCMGAWLRIRAGMHVDAGWPALGAAAAAAILLDGSAKSVRDAIEITAAQLPFGLYLPVTQGADARNTYLGHAAQLGIQSAMAAAAGVVAPRGALQAHAWLALGIEHPMLERSCKPWLIEQGYLKAWPAVRHVHYAVAAALEMRRQLGGESNQRDWLLSLFRIRLLIYPEAITYCANRAPDTPIQAQFSLSFGVAAALCLGRLEPDVYREPAFFDPTLRRLEALIEIAPDTVAGGGRHADLRIEWTDQPPRSQRVRAVPGDIECPLGAHETRAKFVRYAGPVLGVAADPLARRCLDAEGTTSVVDWWQALCGAAGAG